MDEQKQELEKLLSLTMITGSRIVKEDNTLFITTPREDNKVGKVLLTSDKETLIDVIKSNVGDQEFLRGEEITVNNVTKGIKEIFDDKNNYFWRKGISDIKKAYQQQDNISEEVLFNDCKTIYLNYVNSFRTILSLELGERDMKNLSNTLNYFDQNLKEIASNLLEKPQQFV